MNLRTARLLLRPFRPDDVDDALAYRDDAEFARFLPNIPQPFTRRHAQAFVARNMDEPWESMPTFAVVFEDRVIGTVNLEIDTKTRTGDVSGCRAVPRWHLGDGTRW